MIKSIIMAVVLAAMSLPLSAQDAYDAANITSEDLNGTARYVGMGGAMDALGADLSTISSNPAGIGIFRRSHISGTIGVQGQSGVENFGIGSKAHVSFDQLGVVFSTRTGMKKFLNFAFNYNKSRDFHQIVRASNITFDGMSQHAQTLAKFCDMARPYCPSAVDKLYLRKYTSNNSLYDFDKLIDPVDSMYYSNYVDAFDFARAVTGYIGNYNLNISGNINDRVYLGATVGLHDVHYDSNMSYSEMQSNGEPIVLSEDHQITGTGIDVNIGIIIRPWVESPFRIGASISTPTWYTLTSSYYDCLNGVQMPEAFAYKYRMNTPWKFGVSAGHTFGEKYAVGFGYEYQDYTSCDVRIIDEYYGYGYDEYSRSQSDEEMKHEITKNLKGVHSFKIGGEMRLKDFALRAGYNFVSRIYSKEGVRDQTIVSPGVAYASSTDYTNWGDTHRVSVGVGYSYHKLRIDMAYQYSITKGEFFPFMKDDVHVLSDVSYINAVPAIEVKNIRHHLLLTMGYNF